MWHCSHMFFLKMLRGMQLAISDFDNGDVVLCSGSPTTDHGPSLVQIASSSGLSGLLVKLVGSLVLTSLLVIFYVAMRTSMLSFNFQ